MADDKRAAGKPSASAASVPDIEDTETIARPSTGGASTGSAAEQTLVSVSNSILSAAIRLASGSLAEQTSVSPATLEFARQLAAQGGADLDDKEPVFKRPAGAAEEAVDVEDVEGDEEENEEEEEEAPPKRQKLVNKRPAGQHPMACKSAPKRRGKASEDADEEDAGEHRSILLKRPAGVKGGALWQDAGEAASPADDDEGEEEPRKPQNAYWIFLSENREKLAKEAGGGKIAAVGKLAGERWKGMSAAQRSPYEKKAKDAKAAYEKAMEDFKAQGGVVRRRRQHKAGAKQDAQRAKRDNKDPDKPKQPQTAYWLWLSENRASLTKEVGGKDVTKLAKFAGSRWKSLSEKSKAPFENKAAELKSAYDGAMLEYYNQLAGDAGDEDTGADGIDNKDKFKPLSYPHLGLNIKLGQEYEVGGLRKRCRGNKQKLKKLNSLLQNPAYFESC